MSLRQLAVSDLAAITADTKTGFGWDITVTDPSGTSQAVKGITNDISQIIDPDTGQIVSGRSASVAIAISDLTSLPVGIADVSSKPWVIQFNDISGVAYTFKVTQSNPDRTLGIVTCHLGIYE